MQQKILMRIRPAHIVYFWDTKFVLFWCCENVAPIYKYSKGNDNKRPVWFAADGANVKNAIHDRFTVNYQNKK